MSDDRRIAQLEALLARIRSRSRPPRDSPYLPLPPARSRRSHSNPLESPTPLVAFHPSPLPAPPSGPLAVTSPAPRPKYASRPEVPSGLFAKGPREPSYPQHVQPAAPSAPDTPDTGWSLPPEPPPMEVVELEVDPDPSIPPPPPLSDASLEDTRQEGAASARPVEAALESRSRLVSAPPVPLDSFDSLDPLGALEPLEPLELSDPAPTLAPSDPTIEVAAAEVSRAELEALEDEEPPSSSRRAITIEKKMNELDDDVAPLHTPPPESGRLLAALPNLELAFEPEASAAGAEAPERTDVSVAGVEAAEGRPEMSVIRAEPAERADVAVFVTTPRTHLGAKTFGEILDDALSL